MLIKYSFQSFMFQTTSTLTLSVGDVPRGLAAIDSFTCELICHGEGAVGNGESHPRIPFLNEVIGQSRVLQ